MHACKQPVTKMGGSLEKNTYFSQLWLTVELDRGISFGLPSVVSHLHFSAIGICTDEKKKIASC